MASVVTIYANPYTPMKFPPRCCYCLEPATTTVPVKVSVRGVRVSRTRTTSILYGVQMPYCAAHGEQAQRLQRYDRRATIALICAASVALFVIQLVVGGALRSMGPIVWLGATLLMLALLAVGGILLYAVGRWLLWQRYPATVDHIYRRSLGVNTETRLAGMPKTDEAITLAVSFTFHNDQFANAFAALNDSEAHQALGQQGSS